MDKATVFLGSSFFFFFSLLFVRFFFKGLFDSSSCKNVFHIIVISSIRPRLHFELILSISIRFKVFEIKQPGSTNFGLKKEIEK